MCLLEVCSLLKGKQREREVRAELGGVERGETVVGMYCMREESIFN